MRKTIIKTFAESVQNLMHEQNMSAKELARKSGVGYSTLTPIINGHRDCGITKLVAIANALECQVETLLPHLLPSSNKAQAAHRRNQPQYLAVFISQPPVTYCLIHEVSSGNQKTIILPYDLKCTNNTDELLNRVFATLYEDIKQLFTATPPSKHVAVFISAQQYDNIINREKIKKAGTSMFTHFILESDVTTNYQAIFNKTNGICITINEGCTIVHSTDNGESFIKAQGYGFPLTDTAGTDWIACEAFKYVLDVKKRNTPGSSLSDKILAMFNDNINTIAENVSQNPSATYNKISAAVKELVHTDPIAHRIIAHSVKLLHKEIEKIDKTTSTKLPIALIGDLADVYKEFFPQRRLLVPQQKVSDILLSYGFKALDELVNLKDNSNEAPQIEFSKATDSNTDTNTTDTILDLVEALCQNTST